MNTCRYYLNGEEEEILHSDESDMESDEEGLGLKDRRLPDLDGEGDVGDDADTSHPLLTDLVGDKKEDKRLRKAELWFSQVRSNWGTQVGRNLRVCWWFCVGRLEGY